MSNTEESRIESGKRADYISWEEYFMSVAFLSAQRSKDPSTQVGCCIVNKQHKIVGVGYNGMPIGCSDDKLPWQRQTPGDPLGSKYLFVCHAEMNAIMNKNSADVRDCVLYVALFPCNECAKIIVQSGIAEVVYLSDKYCGTVHNQAAKCIFDMAGVRHRQFTPRRRSIVIDFDRLPDETNAALAL